MEKTFIHHSFNIHYSDLGKGMPVMLLHGFGEDSRIWQEQVTFLEKHCRLLVPDLPGSGLSTAIGPDRPDQITNGTPSDIDKMADAVAAVATNAGVEKFVLLGHSMGGYITLAFAEKYPEKLSGFGLIHSTAFADTEEKKETRRKGIDFIKRNGGFPFMQTAIPGLFTESFKTEQPGKIAAQVEQFDPSVAPKEETDAELIAYYNAMINRPDRTAVLEEAEVPVLFILGTEDKAAPMDDVLKQVHLPQISHMHIIEHCAHMSMVEYPGLLNQYLLKFIGEIKGLNKS